MLQNFDKELYVFLEYALLCGLYGYGSYVY